MPKNFYERERVKSDQGKLNNLGFTLIELLVVISIIGFLATASMVVFNSVRMKARDSKRKADLTQIRKALDLNFDKNNAYTQPENMCIDTSYGGFGSCGAAGGTGDWDANSDLRDLIRDGFMKTLPKDPLNNATYKYTYEPWNAGEGGYATSGQNYTLCATLEMGGSYCIKSN